MNCDKCGEEATIHDLKLVKGGIISQVHLCEKCAADLGMVGKSFKTIEELLQEAIKSHQPLSSGPSSGPGASGSSKSGTALVRRTPGATCGTCGLTWSEFRDQGVLGCPDCYTAFASRLTPLLGRAHEGGTHHIGKVPRQFKDKADIEPKVRHLRKQLAEALLTEQYERAARLRDQLVAMGVTTTAERVGHDTDPPPVGRPLRGTTPEDDDKDDAHGPGGGSSSGTGSGSGSGRTSRDATNDRDRERDGDDESNDDHDGDNGASSTD
ncbi:MAG: UvrB/UvrC motif-containing protein [Planctomycetota bacterium]